MSPVSMTVMPRIPAHLSIPNARLPVVYERAREALSECSRVDECKDWADKALALSSYARQAQDDSLEKLAMRIRARAIRRAGELLRTFDGRDGRNLPDAKRGTGSPFSRSDAAESAGMSGDQRKQAVRVARIPEAEFDAMVESDDPPSVTKLAAAGRRARSEKKPDGFQQATAALGALDRFAKFCAQNDPELVAGGVLPDEVEAARRDVSAIDAWLDRFVVNLRGDE